MSRPSDPILKWFRDMMNERGMNIASLAKSLGQPKGVIRKVLSGQSDMTLDQLIQFSEALGLSQEDLAAVDLHARCLQAVEHPHASVRTFRADFLEGLFRDGGQVHGLEISALRSGASPSRRKRGVSAGAGCSELPSTSKPASRIIR